MREGIIKGRPKTNLPWQKVFIVVEGVYSMEGTIAQLPEIIDMNNKYKVISFISHVFA